MQDGYRVVGDTGILTLDGHARREFQQAVNTANDGYQEEAGEYRGYDIAALVEHISDRVKREKKA